MCHVHFVPFAMKNVSPDVKVSQLPFALVNVTDPEITVIISWAG
jgi:hypothetical protein